MLGGRGAIAITLQVQSDPVKPGLDCLVKYGFCMTIPSHRPHRFAGDPQLGGLLRGQRGGGREQLCAGAPFWKHSGGEHVRFAEHRQARWCHQGRNVRRGWGFFVAWIGVQKTRKTRCTELFEVGEGEKQVGLGRPL